MIEFLIFFVGYILGGVMASIVFRRNRAGTLRFYKIDPSEPPAMTAILDKAPDEISKHDYAVFYISHE